jgi:hypothetical protein
MKIRKLKTLCARLIAFGAATLVAATTATLKAQNLYVGSAGNGPNSIISEYGLDGSTINPTFISVPNDNLTDMVLSGNDLYVTSSYIYEFTSSGATVGGGAPLISLAEDPTGIAISGNDLFVAYAAYNGVAEYTTSGATVNGLLISGATHVSAIATSGDDLFVADQSRNAIAEYTTSGTLINASFISDVPDAHILISGNDMFVSNEGNNSIGEYTLSGATVNASLITGLSQPTGMAIYGNDLYVAEDNAGIVGEYGLDGSTINASLISGLNAPTTLLIYPAPEPSTIALASLGAVALCGCNWRRQNRHHTKRAYRNQEQRYGENASTRF